MKRLNYLLDFIPKNTKVIADIGTDHAYLPIKAIKNHYAEIIYATDISIQALIQAKLNLQKHHLDNSQSIKLIQSDGLDFLKDLPKIEIDYVIIAGLGSKTIYNIIHKPYKMIKYYLILSNTEISNIRQWAKTNNFKIENEDFFWENDHHYLLILINSQAVYQTNHNLKFGDWKKWYQNNAIYRDYLKNLQKLHLQHQKKINDPISKQENADYIKQIGKYLEQWN